MAICAKLLQVANSSFFGLRRAIDTVDDAVRYLGLETVRSLALSVGAFRMAGASGSMAEELQLHALEVCRKVRTLPEAQSRRGDLFVAAMLHDIGKLVLSVRLPGHLERAAHIARRDGIALHEAEYEISGISHAEVGGYLLGIWGLPCSIVEAVAYHHGPGRIPHREYELVDAIHVADLLVHEEQDPERAAISHRSLSLSHLSEPPLPELGDYRRFSQQRERPAP
jgi:HD-like signal output (HDOD) protein